MKSLLPTEIQKVFILSPANGCPNNQEWLPIYNWRFPQSTWLSTRRELVKRLQSDEDLDSGAGKE